MPQQNISHHATPPSSPSQTIRKPMHILSKIAAVFSDRCGRQGMSYLSGNFAPEHSVPPSMTPMLPQQSEATRKPITSSFKRQRRRSRIELKATNCLWHLRIELKAGPFGQLLMAPSDRAQSGNIRPTQFMAAAARKMGTPRATFLQFSLPYNNPSMAHRFSKVPHL